jgi:tyrosyl-tRNA synthetase
VLVGGGTGLIGDPSGKTGERQLSPVEQVAAWAERLKAQVRLFLDFDGGPGAAILVDNYAWLSKLEVITFLRDIGKHFAVGAMVARESVKSRMGRADAGISYTEFSYQILQAYDFMALADRYDCTVQFGGSDQWGNITAGIDLIRRVRGRAAYGLTLPLVTKEDGTKFGKTETGTVWLDPRKTSAYEMYQFWLNTADADVVRFLKYFTFLSLEEIDGLARRMTEAPERREAQRVLAREITTLVHGAEAVREAERTAVVVFPGRPPDATEARPLEGGALPLAFIQASEPRFLWSILKEAGIVASASEARRLIAQGGVAVNRHRVPGLEFKLGEGQHLVQIGKRRFWRVLVGPEYETRPWQQAGQKPIDGA